MPETRKDRKDPKVLAEDVAHHLKYTLSKDYYSARTYDRYLAVAHAVRDRIVERWIETQQQYHRRNAKRAYFISFEFLLGRSLRNNLVNLGMVEAAREALAQDGHELDDLFEAEPDAGLGNGGLGRLAACFLESLATHAYPSMGYGLRYEYGLFRQQIRDGRQIEEPDNWLALSCPWEFPRPEYAFSVHFGGRVEADPADPLRRRWVDTHVVKGVPYDVPVVGAGSDTVNTLRLWSARSSEDFDLEDFSCGDYAAAVEHKVMAETLTKVLYPDDRVNAGRELRLRQQYFLVSCTLQDVLRRHKADQNPLEELPEKAAIQLNDTHPALSIAELMRLLVDVERLPWDVAWDLTRATCAYTNHTLMPEALEQWPVDLLGRMLPRHLEIIFEVNRRLLEEVAHRWPGDPAPLSRLSLVDESNPRRIRMAHLAVVGSHAVNGVSEIHSGLVKTRLFPGFNELWPERFMNKTNGVTPRRWLRASNPRLSGLITELLGHEEWVRDLDRLRELEPWADDPAVQERFMTVKRQAKDDLADYLARTTGLRFDPSTLLDVQIKRLHEYKRQLLNLLHVAHLYLRLREDRGVDMVPRTFLFGAKAAPGYEQAKRIIELIHRVGRAIDEDPRVGGRLKVIFVPDYRVTLAERIIPAAEVSEQISTAGTEASGTSNMKLALNGALTLGTLDGATIEIRDAVGEENLFTFGLDAAEVAALHASGRNPGWEAYHANPDIRRVVDFVCSGEFGPPELLDPIRQAILVRPDPYMHLVDLPSYVEAHARVAQLYLDPAKWARKALLTVSRMGRFSSDRTIAEYAREIWGVNPSPIDMTRKVSVTMRQMKQRPK